jgi:sugar phosphate isomerase/epimerase
MNAVYVSSSVVKFEKIEESVSHLAKNGFKNIELSGGTNFADHHKMMNNLLDLKTEFKLNYIIHNYFPPPEEAFILNLATNDSDVLAATEKHLLQCLEYSNQLEASKFGFHAGFFFNIPLHQIGGKITASVYDDFSKAFSLFCERYAKIKNKANELGVKLYIENNVYSKTNAERYGIPTPAMLVDKESFNELNKTIDFNLLLDVAHLKVSSKTLKRDFVSELNFLFNSSDYIHVSDNDGLHDTNNGFQPNSELFEQLKNLNWTNKTVTLEVYEPLEQVAASVDTINLILNA